MAARQARGPAPRSGPAPPGAAGRVRLPRDRTADGPVKGPLDGPVNGFAPPGPWPGEKTSSSPRRSFVRAKPHAPPTLLPNLTTRAVHTRRILSKATEHMRLSFNRLFTLRRRYTHLREKHSPDDDPGDPRI